METIEGKFITAILIDPCNLTDSSLRLWQFRRTPQGQNAVLSSNVQLSFFLALTGVLEKALCKTLCLQRESLLA